MKTYDVILADPPWTFLVWNADKSYRHASHKYDLMTVEDICALPISKLASDNCVLFIWATYPNLQDVFKVIESWGFNYRTLGFEWVKMNTSGKGWHIGMGYYSRANPEPCLLAVRGTMPVSVHNERNLLCTYEDEMFGLPMVSKIREHSRKPDESYKKIERLYPNTEKLELFARRKRAGWDVFGNEVADSITLPDSDIK